MLLGFTVGGSLVGLLLTMSVFRDIIESIFIDGLTEKEYLDYLRRTERRKYSARKMVRMYKERPRKFSSNIMTYRTVSFVFLAIHLILTAAIIICTDSFRGAAGARADGGKSDYRRNTRNFI